MWNMEFLKQNAINTTTVLSTTVNTSTLLRLIDRDKSVKWETSGYSSDTVSVIVLTPTATHTISRIAIINHNLKAFSIYYGDTTTNLISLTGSTNTTNWTTNSETSHYLVIATTTISPTVPLTLRMTGAQTADTERYIGEYYVGQDYFRFANNPAASNYEPKPEEKMFKHSMSDGGLVKYFLKEKFTADIKLDFVSSAERANFKNVYDQHLPFMFVPFPNTSTWDGDMYEVNWENSFDFYKLETEQIGNGYRGSIQLYETPV